MNADNALRFLAHQAKVCRDRDRMEMHLLLFPAMLDECGLEAMDDFEAECFLRDFKERRRKREVNPNGEHKPGVFVHLLR